MSKAVANCFAKVGDFQLHNFQLTVRRNVFLDIAVSLLYRFNITKQRKQIDTCLSASA